MLYYIFASSSLWGWYFFHVDPGHGVPACRRQQIRNQHSYRLRIPRALCLCELFHTRLRFAARFANLSCLHLRISCRPHLQSPHSATLNVKYHHLQQAWQLWIRRGPLKKTRRAVLFAFFLKYNPKITKVNS